MILLIFVCVWEREKALKKAIHVGTQVLEIYYCYTHLATFCVRKYFEIYLEVRIRIRVILEIRIGQIFVICSPE